MSLDRVVRWKEKKPKKKEVQYVVEDFFNGFSVYWDKDRWFVKLPGKPKAALVRVEKLVTKYSPTLGVREDERWIEVWPSKGCLYIMTRLQDDFTNALAVGLLEVFRRYWQAEVDPG